MDSSGKGLAYPEVWKLGSNGSRASRDGGTAVLSPSGRDLQRFTPPGRALLSAAF